MNVSGTGSATSQYASSTQKSDSQNGLGKDAFLKILVTQMKNQNPMEPLKDTEFIAQMAQFSSLEQLTNLNTAFNQLVELQGNPSKSIADYANLIGTTVSWEQEVDGQKIAGEGNVKALSMKNGEFLVELEDDTKVSLDSILRIEKPVPSTSHTVESL